MESGQVEEALWPVLDHCACGRDASLFPNTSRSKSTSPTLKEPSGSVEGILIRLLDRTVSRLLVELEARSRNFLDCSCSIFKEIVLMSVIYAWNCSRLSRGPRLKLHKVGNIFMARKSTSAIFPTSLNTVKAAIITAGSFVLMPLRRGTTFSCTVYLSRIAPFEAFVPVELMAGLRPQRIPRASRPRTLIDKLLVLVKTLDTIGNRSFLIVEKSSMPRIDERQVRDLSTTEWVGD